MELEKLIKKRDAYAGKILHLGIQIAAIFLVPIVLAIVIHWYLDISYFYLFPLAFIISWTGVIILYRKISKEVRELDNKIKELREQESKSEESNSLLENK